MGNEGAHTWRLLQHGDAREAAEALTDAHGCLNWFCPGGRLNGLVSGCIQGRQQQIAGACGLYEHPQPFHGAQLLLQWSDTQEGTPAHTLPPDFRQSWARLAALLQASLAGRWLECESREGHDTCRVCRARETRARSTRAPWACSIEDCPMEPSTLCVDWTAMSAP